MALFLTGSGQFVLVLQGIAKQVSQHCRIGLVVFAGKLHVAKQEYWLTGLNTTQKAGERLDCRVGQCSVPVLDIRNVDNARFVAFHFFEQLNDGGFG